MLREFYPAALVAFGDDLAGRTRWRCWPWRPARSRARRLTAARVGDGCCGRPAGNATSPARAEQIVAALRTEQLAARPGVVGAYAASAAGAGRGDHRAGPARSTCWPSRWRRVLAGTRTLRSTCSQPGLGEILGARVLAEFGDDPDRYADARARKNYSGMAPVTRTSGQEPGRAGPPRPQPAPGRRALPTGVRRAEQLTRRPRLLRRPPRPRQHPPPSPARTGQPTRRHPPRLPAPPHALRRNPPPGPTTPQPPLDSYEPWDV